MKILRISLMWIVACLSFSGTVNNACAQWAVIDAANLQQSFAQYTQMVEQVSQLRALARALAR